MDTFLCRFLFAGQYSNSIHKIDIMIARLPVSYSSCSVFCIFTAFITFSIFVSVQITQSVRETHGHDGKSDSTVETAIVLDTQDFDRGNIELCSASAQ